MAYIEYSDILGTKIDVIRRDANMVQRCLFKMGCGYELALEKDYTLRKFKNKVIFFVDYSGYITYAAREEMTEDEYLDLWYGSKYEEMDYAAFC